MKMRIDFPGRSQVDAHFGDFRVRTDQPPEKGGDGSAPAPFDYFLASLGTCAGLYVLNFLRRRGIPTDDVHLTLSTVEDPERRLLSVVTIVATVPAGFPEKYRNALVNAMNLCTVKRQMLDPPRFETIVEVGDPVAA